MLHVFFAASPVLSLPLADPRCPLADPRCTLHSSIGLFFSVINERPWPTETHRGAGANRFEKRPSRLYDCHRSITLYPSLSRVSSFERRNLNRRPFRSSPLKIRLLLRIFIFASFSTTKRGYSRSRGITNDQSVHFWRNSTLAEICEYRVNNSNKKQSQQ